MTEKTDKKYQDMLGEVENIVQDISSSELDLDELVNKVEHGYKLIKSMRERLNEVKERVETLHSEFNSDQESN